MCNLFANVSSNSEMRQLFDVQLEDDYLGNFPPLSSIFPKTDAPIIKKNTRGERQIVYMSWGFRTPNFSKRDGQPIKPQVWNNARDDKLRSTSLWKNSFVNRRCLIAATSYCETKGRKPAEYFWFGIIDPYQDKTPRPLFAIAGIWREEDSLVHKELCKSGHFTMITTNGNDLVIPIHAKGRMPAIINREDYEQWLDGSPEDAFSLIKTYPQEKMQILKSGFMEKDDSC